METAISWVRTVIKACMNERLAKGFVNAQYVHFCDIVTRHFKTQKRRQVVEMRHSNTSSSTVADATFNRMNMDESIDIHTPPSSSANHTRIPLL